MEFSSSIFESPRQIPDANPDIRVGFILTPRFSLLPFASFIESLRHAADDADYGRQIFCAWSVLGETLEPVHASCGLEVMPDSLFSEGKTFDYIVVVGGQLPFCMDIGDATECYIRQSFDEGISVIGLCTGSFILTSIGLLEGRRCVVHPEHLHQFQSLFPDGNPVTDQIYLNDGRIITCPGGTSALDLAFALIEERCGKSRAVKGLTTLLVDRHRTAQHMPHRPFEHLRTCGNKRVEEAIILMERNITTPYPVSRIATLVGVSERELNRAFNVYAGDTPVAIWRRMRLAHSHWLLINTSRTVTHIGLETGFSDGAHFCRWFKKVYNETPLMFRRRHRPGTVR